MSFPHAYRAVIGTPGPNFLALDPRFIITHEIVVV